MIFGKMFGGKSKIQAAGHRDKDASTASLESIVSLFELFLKQSSNAIFELFKSHGVDFYLDARLRLDIVIEAFFCWTIIVSLRKKSVDDREIFKLLNPIERASFSRYLAYRYFIQKHEQKQQQINPDHILNEYLDMMISFWRKLDDARNETGKLEKTDWRLMSAVGNSVIAAFIVETIRGYSDLESRWKSDLRNSFSFGIDMFQLLFVSIPEAGNEVADRLLNARPRAP